MLVVALCAGMQINAMETEESVTYESAEENFAEKDVLEVDTEIIDAEEEVWEGENDVNEDGEEWLLSNEENAEGVFVAAESEAVSGSCGLDDSIHWEFDGIDTLTISGSGEMLFFGTSVPVTAPWSGYREQIKTVHICGGITSIGKEAFKGFSNLMEVTITDSVTVIESAAFYGCCSLGHIMLPDNVTTIEHDAFCGCNFKNITLPDSVTLIGAYAFFGCADLINIIIPPNVELIEDSAFRNCINLTNVVFSGRDTGMESGVFYDCTNLVYVELPDNMEIVELYTFAGCSSLVEIVLPDSVKTIKGAAFDRCSSLESIKLSDRLEAIDASFRGCSKLANIVLPDSVRTIGDEAFYDCDSLTEIIFPENVTSIGNKVFEYCDNLQSVKFCGDAPQFGEEAFFLNYSLTAYYPADNETWTEDVRQDYCGGVTWVPYEGNSGETDDELLAAAISTITLSPSKDAFCGKPNEPITINLTTTGELILNTNPEAYMEIRVENERYMTNYMLFGDGSASVNLPNSDERNCMWEDSGLDIVVSDNSLSIEIPWIANGKIANGEVEVEFCCDFLSINGKSINSKNEEGQDILSWSFRTPPDTYDSFNFKNEGTKIPYGIYKKMLGAVWAIPYYIKNPGEKGVCYGMGLAEALFAFADIPDLGLVDFNKVATCNWELDKKDKNNKEKLTLDEYVQMCFVAEFLPEVSEERQKNKSFGNDKRPDKIEQLVNAVKEFMNNGKTDPVIIGISDSEGNHGHEVLAYNYVDYQDITNIYILDSNHPGCIDVIILKKNGTSYTGEWEYENKYCSSDNEKNYITFSHPKTPFLNAYGKQDNKSAVYLLDTKVAMSPDNRIIKIDFSAGEASEVLESTLYWILGEKTVSFDIVDTDNISIMGNGVAVQYNNLQTGTATISMQEDNFSFATNQSGQKDAEVSYLFYNENDIKKVTIREPEQDRTLEVYNKDEKIYFKGLNSAEIKTETGDYNENGDFVPENTVVKTFTNLSEEEEYEVDGSQEIEHIVRVSDDTVIPEGSPDKTEKPLQNIQLSETEINLHEGESQMLEVFYTPNDTTDDKSVVWTSSDESVAVIDAVGKISALKAGNTVITALVGEESALCHVTVTENKQPEETEKPVSTETPSQPTEEPVSTDTPRPSIPTSEPVQTSEPEKPGQTEIPVPTEKPEQPQPTEEPASTVAPEQPVPTAEPTSTQTPEQPYPTGTPVPVHTPEPQKPLQSIDFEQKNITLQPGETSKLNVIYTPADTTDSREVIWVSSDEAVASVTTEGTVTAHKTGTTEITAKVGEKTAVCTVTVKTSGQESNAEDENDNRNESSNSNTDEQTAEAQQETGALSSPKTGERDNWMIYVILAGSILAGITAISVLLRKKQEK